MSTKNDFHACFKSKNLWELIIISFHCQYLFIEHEKSSFDVLIAIYCIP